MDIAMLTRLLQMGPAQMGPLAEQAAMKASPPNLMPNPGMLSQSAFGGMLDPSAGVMPPPMGMPQGQAPGGQMPVGFNAQQAGILGNMSQKQPLHFPGAAHFARAGNIQTSGIGVPQVQQPRASLAQLLGG